MLERSEEGVHFNERHALLTLEFVHRSGTLRVFMLHFYRRLWHDKRSNIVKIQTRLHALAIANGYLTLANW